MTDPSELADVTRTMAPRVSRLASQICGHDAADGQQEVFRELTRSWPSYRGDAEPTTWAHRLAIRTLVRFAARQRRRREREPSAGDMRLSLDEHALANFADNPLTRLVAEERRARVHAALRSLSPPLRDVLVLRIGEGLDYAAIATALDLPLGTVKSRIAAATLRLAERLHDVEES
jgi:RNA polymerase sigma-70 factor (ECF subfamily)